ncbi:MAG: hypothetical protein HYU66_24010 [Armatimonadetes bacterium]|nr:hypothetical protein [Armatimonadota bacterium]
MLLRRRSSLPVIGATAALCLCPSVAQANYGTMTIEGLTPMAWGWGYLLVLVPLEAWIIAKVADLAWSEALRCSFGANVVSGLVGTFAGVLGFNRALLEPVLLAPGLVGLDAYHPVTRLLGATVCYYLASVAIEAPYIGAYLPRRTAWRAAAAANGVSYALAAMLLLLSPYPYRATSSWRMSRMGHDLQAALRAYELDHQGEPPPDGEPFSVNRALMRYLSPTRESLVREGRIICYDRLRLDGRYPEWPLKLEGKEGRHCFVYHGTPPWDPLPERGWYAFPRLCAPLIGGP